MAIGAGSAGAWAAANAGTQTITLPSHATGDLLVLVVAQKATTVANVNHTIGTATGWTCVSRFADGSVVSGTGTGSVFQTVWYKVATSSSETNPVVTFGDPGAPSIAVAVGFTKASGESWLVPEVRVGATNAATSISVTMPSNPGITAGDWGLAVHTTADDSALTVPTWTATGTTLGTATVYPTTPIATTTSNDMAGTIAYRSVTSGTASAAPVVTGTQAAAETGVTAFIRLRVVTTPAGTVIYPTTTASSVSTASDDREAWTSRGAASYPLGTFNPLGPGPISPSQLFIDSVVGDWFTRPLAAFTLNGTVAATVRGFAGVTKPVAVLIEIARVEGDGTSPTVWATSTPTAEVLPTNPGPNIAFVEGTSMAISDGQRLRIRFYADDAANGTMLTNTSVSLTFSGPTPGANGDTYLTFPATLTESTGAAANPPYTNPYPPLLAQ